MAQATALMLDAVDTAALPSNPLYLAEIDGRDTAGNAAAIAAAHPGATIITNTVVGDPRARVIDCEPGAVWPPAKAASVAHDAIADGLRPTIYFAASIAVAVHQAVAQLGDVLGTGGNVDGLVADWDGVAEIPVGYVGKQFSTGAYDRSIVYVPWAYPDPPAPTPPIPEDDTVIKVYTTAAPLRSAQIVVENAMRYRLLEDDTEDLATVENIFTGQVEPGVRTTLDGFGDPANGNTARFFGVTWPL